MTSNRWTDAFLDAMRKQGDALADDSLIRIMRDREIAVVHQLFAEIDTNNEKPSITKYSELSEFFEATDELPPGTDLKRIARGEKVFQDNAFTAALVLLTKSLPEGYAAPNLSVILNLSGNLKKHPYKRLLTTLQAVVNVSTFHGFQNGGRAIVTAQKLRLLHAGIRHLTRQHCPDFELRHSTPVNLEDMLATVMGFSYLVIEGMRTLDAGLTAQQEEDYLYLWRVFAQRMGIHPAGRPDSFEYIPENLEDAGLFYEAYRRRHYVTADKNPDGVALGHANLKMLKHFVPRILRFFGFGAVPRLYMLRLMGEEQCSLIGIKRMRAHGFVSWILFALIRLWRPIEQLRTKRHERIGMMIFQQMIARGYGGEVTFTIPLSVGDLKGMDASTGARGYPSR